MPLDPSSSINENGLFLETSSSGTYFVLRRNITGTPEDHRVEQTAWNRASLLVGDRRQNLPALDLDMANILV
ncbi:hypothetical protein LCGC14_2949420, partial [marine sediment metagenome]